FLQIQQHRFVLTALLHMPRRIVQIRQDMLAPGALKGNNCHSLRKEKIKTLRYCDECVADCREATIEPYYRIDQQLPGVYVCPKHGTLLRWIAGTEKMAVRHPGSLATLASSKDTTTFEELKPLELQAMADLARRSAHVLVSPDFDIKNYPYREMLKEAGLLSKAGDVRRDAVIEACDSYFGAQFCWVTGFDDFHVLRLLHFSVPNAGATQIFRTLAVQSMLSYLASEAGAYRPRVEVNPANLLGSLVCSGKLHRDADSFGDPRFVKSSGRYVTDCTCGVSISIRVDRDENVVDRKTVRLGSRYKAVFRGLIKRGVSVSNAGKDIGIKWTAWAWKREDSPKVSQLYKSSRDVLRKKWRACVESSPVERRLKTAKEREPRLYRKLQTYDKKWLQQFNSRHRSSKRLSDACLMESFARLNGARKLLADRLPPEQVTIKALITIARAGLKGPLRGRHGPMVKQHISTLVEERSVFVDRLIDYWLEELDGERVVNMAQFHARCGFSCARLTAVQRSRVLEWLSANAQSWKSA
ncbi:TniQ family protein, partial [Burkholderia ubonensis]|uniref:TniQ family protein n=1 Tax=Burkholderia ubonensis TaxID=101571 RepID=UPI000A5055EE